jgi:glycosyltransferase involved in cell wall biosynthesis
MRILHCIPSMGGGGAERQLTYLAAELSRMGWDVHVALLNEGPNFNRLKSSDATIHKLTARNNYDPRILGQLLRTVHTVKPDLIQVWINQMEILGGTVAQIMRLPWIFSERSSEFFYSSTNSSNLKNRLRLFLASRANAIVSNSSGGDRYWRTHLKDRVPQYIIPNIVPLEEIEADPSRVLPDIDLDKAEKVVLFVGRFDAGKNVDTLIVALEEVLQQLDVVAVLCGDGPFRPRIQQLLKHSAIAQRVLLPGYVSNAIALYKRADVFVSLSLYEGHPNAVLEAAACSCPLVLSDIPAHREFLNDHSATFVNPHEPTQVAQAITKVLSDPLQAKVRASNARKAIQEFSAAKIASQYQQVYLNVLAQSHKRRNN